MRAAKVAKMKLMLLSFSLKKQVFKETNTDPKQTKEWLSDPNVFPIFQVPADNWKPTIFNPSPFQMIHNRFLEL